ncbi:phosphosugar isomerase, partial [Klebsiella pneumoniae]
MNTKEIINAVAKEIEDKGGIRQVFLVACGGSLVDMYPAKYFLDSEATKLHVGMYTA